MIVDGSEFYFLFACRQKHIYSQKLYFNLYQLSLTLLETFSLIQSKHFLILLLIVPLLVFGIENLRNTNLLKNKINHFL